MSTRITVATAMLVGLAVAGVVARVVTGGAQERELLPIDPSMLEVTAATGGDFYFWEPGEFAHADLSVPFGADDDVLLAYGTLETAPRVYEVPVDTLVSRLEVFAGAQLKDGFELSSPAGEPAAELPSARLQAFEHMSLWTVQDPEPGLWRLELSGRGAFSVSARADGVGTPAGSDLAPIELVDAELVELRGRPGHEGYFPSRQPPLTGSTALLRARIDGSFASAELGFVTVEGDPLGELTPLAAIPDEPGLFLQPITVPAVPFRVRVRGRDRTGTPFQRFSGPLLEPRRSR